MTTLRGKVRKSAGLPVETVRPISLPTGVVIPATTSLPTGTSLQVDMLPQMQIIRLQGNVNEANHHIRILEEKIVGLTKRMEQAEKDRIVRFENNDVYEVNKRIERLEAKVALISSHFFNNRAIQFCLRFFNG